MKNLKHKLPEFGIALLILLNFAVGYELVNVFMEDPMSRLPTPRPPVGIKLGEDDAEVQVIKAGVPPSALLAWDPFLKKGPGLKPPEPTGTNEGEPKPPSDEIMISVDAIRLRGLITLNGQRHALLEIESDDRRMISQEVHGGSKVRGFDDLTVLDVTADGIILSKPGFLKTPVLLERPIGTMRGWFTSEEDADENQLLEIE